MTEHATVVDWVLRAVMALVSVFVFLLGRDQKRNEELIEVRAQAVKDHLAGALAERDVRLDSMATRLESGGEKLSDLASFAQGFGAREERLRREMEEVARAALHEAIDALAPLIADLNLKKIDERLHTEQVEDIRRRLSILEEGRP